MHSGLEARVPFADRALVEYIFNVPWEMKAKDGTVKNVLRQASKGLLPDEILFRKKVLIRRLTTLPMKHCFLNAKGCPVLRKRTALTACGQRKSVAFLRSSKGLRYSMVRSAYGRTADDCLSVADQLLVKKSIRLRSFYKCCKYKNPHHSQMVGGYFLF